MKHTRLFVSLPGLALGLAVLSPGCGNSSSANPPPTSKRDAGSVLDASSPDEAGSNATCGDGVVSGTETCDTKIATGNAGVCPSATTCDDHDPCTTDAILAAGTCSAACDAPAKVAASTGAKDQCCPPGSDYTTDSDCNPNCGNGKLDPSEACDPKITSGTGVCTTSCDDGNPCTTDTLVTADPCNPKCNSTPITAPKNGDGCCPSSANATTDSDCSATCGNGTVEPGEDCDETSDNCKNCKWVPTAFRFTSLEVAQPTMDYDCNDITFAVNQLITGNFVSDTSGSKADGGGADGRLDLSFILLTRPLVQTGSSGSGEFLSDANCPAPAPPATCSPDATISGQAAKVTNQSSGTCLAADPSRVSPPDAAAEIPNVASAGADGCYLSQSVKLSLSIAGIPLTFDTARLAAEWVGTPATGMNNGLIEAFMSMEQARAIILPASTPAVGGKPLSILLRGSPENTCAGADDSHPGPDGVTVGYWFYFNFTAEKVGWTGN